MIRLGRSRLIWLPADLWRALSGLVALSVVLFLALRAYQATLLTVTVRVDGQVKQVHTHQRTVGALLDELGLALADEDELQPEPAAPLTSGLVIEVRRARPVWVEADGEAWQLRTQATTVAELLLQTGLVLDRHDELYLDGVQVTPETDLPPIIYEERSPGYRPGPVWTAVAPVPLRLVIRRAVPLVVHDGDMIPYTLYTTAPTIGEALRRVQFTLYLGDEVLPGLGARVTSGQHVYVHRSTPILITVDGRTIKTRTRKHTVGDALTEQGIAVAGLDRVTPAMEAAVQDNLEIRIVRVREAIEVEQESLPFETVWIPDDDLEIDHRRVDQQGTEGLIKRRFRVVYEDGQEVRRTLEDEWVAQEPENRVIAYGRKIVPRQLETPDGVFTYWRKIRMLATSYSAASSGKRRDSPQFGITRLGWRMRTGIVAVDPSVINLGSQVYVFGYGVGDAADTGGRIRGRHIDLGYAEHELKLWFRWVDVYLLWPPPPRHQIRWVLPNWPQERRR